MTNEEKVQKYKEEIEAVFSTENVINALNRYDKFKEEGDLESIKILDNITLGIRQKEYWVKFSIDEPNILNSFLLEWITGGKSIAGVKGEVLDYNGVANKPELKNKLLNFINEL